MSAAAGDEKRPGRLGALEPLHISSASSSSDLGTRPSEPSSSSPPPPHRATSLHTTHYNLSILRRSPPKYNIPANFTLSLKSCLSDILRHHVPPHSLALFFTTLHSHSLHSLQIRFFCKENIVFSFSSQKTAADCKCSSAPLPLVILASKQSPLYAAVIYNWHNLHGAADVLVVVMQCLPWISSFMPTCVRRCVQAAER